VNLNDYETKYFSTYKAFAETVRFILEKAILAAENLPRPQSIQCRAKGVESLRRRLADAGMLDTQKLELDRRDLAGGMGTHRERKKVPVCIQDPSATGGEMHGLDSASSEFSEVDR